MKVLIARLNNFALGLICPVNSNPCKANENHVTTMHANSRHQKLIWQFLICGMLINYSLISFTYGGDGLFSTLATKLDEAYRDFIPIVTVLAFFFSGCAAIAHFSTSDDRKAGIYKSWSFRIIAVYALFLVLPWLIKQIVDMIGADRVAFEDLNDYLSD